MIDMMVSRRQGLSLAALDARSAAVPAFAATATAKGPMVDLMVDFGTRIDFKDPKWNRDTYARLDADLNLTKEKRGSLYMTTFAPLPGGEQELPADLVAAARVKDKKWLDVPTRVNFPSLSSHENYARENTRFRTAWLDAAAAAGRSPANMHRVVSG